ncbi:MAG: pseudouridine synthase [Acidobacteria bacterium]|nr:pseudouridine synthase [Acidobacteriota bacterium]
MKYILLNKPYEVVCQFSKGEEAERTLADFVPVPDVYPVGRLDADSEGLVLLTDDGQLQHMLTDPSFGHAKTYWAQVEGLPTPEALDTLRNGVLLKGFKTKYRTRPAKARVMDPAPELWERNPPIRFRAKIPTAWIEIELQEGRNRQVRRMTAKVGFPTLRLVRTAIGDLRVDGLQPGEWRDLKASELARVLRLKESPLRVRRTL